MLYKKIKIKNNDKNQNIITRILNSRGIQKKEDIERFLNPSYKDFISPDVFCDMEKAKKRIFEAIEKQEKILIWGDFDCDGVTSSVILFKTLEELKANVIKFIPDRLLHGHGLNSKELIKLISKEKVKLVITVDCGISNINEVNLLKGLKVDTIITDHHTTDIDLPDAFAIINPQVQGAINDNLSAKEIEFLTYNSGSIVAYKLAMSLLADNKNNKLKDELLVIASCGAIADVVPLLGENRSIVYEGLKLLNEKKEASAKSIYRLLSKNINNKEITSYDIAFILAPRINAVGRLANAELSFEFLYETNDENIDIIIQKLDNYNSIRQAKCSEVYDDILNYLKSNKNEENNDAIILINNSWHIGVIGIVASQVVEEYNKPCFLMTVDENNYARCSIRSNEKINVYQILKENQELFSGFGGHKLAGGCSFDLNQISFEQVKEALLKSIKETKNENDMPDEIIADIEIEPEELNKELLEEIQKLEPFGQNNELPLFAMFEVNFIDSKIIGKEQNHLKMVFEKNSIKMDAVKWKESSILIQNNTICDIAFYPRLNVFNDVESIQLEIKDIYSTEINIKKSDNKIKIYDHRLKKGILEQINDYLKKDELDIKIWANTISTKEKIEKFPNIKKNIMTNQEPHTCVMFFDYPSSEEEFFEILTSINPKKIHFMNIEIDENPQNYIKQINGMIKYCSNKLNGNINLKRFSRALGVSENYIQTALEILENIGSIKILDVDKIEYIKPFNFEEFKNNSMYDILDEEFEQIINFKKSLLKCSIQDIEEYIEKIKITQSY